MQDEHMQAFEMAASKILAKLEPLIQPQDENTLVAYPVSIENKLQAVLVLALSIKTDSRLRGLMRELHWATGWIEAQLWRGQAALGKKQVASAKLTLDLMAALEQHERFDAAALSIVNAVPDLTGFDHAALGIMKRGRVRMEAFSRAATFKRKADHIADYEAAMDEAVAQGDCVVYPQTSDGRTMIDLAHRHLARRVGAGAIVSAPLIVRGTLIGSLLLEKKRKDDEVVRIDVDTLEDIRLAAATLAPVIDAKVKERRLMVRSFARIVRPCRYRLSWGDALLLALATSCRADCCHPALF
jgi:hypothetical protein